MFYTLGLGLQQASCFGKTFTGLMCFFSLVMMAMMLMVMVMVMQIVMCDSALVMM